MRVLQTIILLLLPVTCAPIARARERTPVHLTPDLIGYWSYYTRFSDQQALNSAYVKMDAQLHTPRQKCINDLAFVKCIVELSMLDKSYELLQKHKTTVARGDAYIKGAYCLVNARLLLHVNRKNDAIHCNQRAINYLKRTGHTAELKNALLNQGYFYATVNEKKAMQCYEAARKLEQQGEQQFYVLLRTNLAIQHLYRNEHQKAEEYCNQAQEYLRRNGNSNYLDEFRVLIIQASVAEQQQKHALEDSYLEKARQLAANHHMYHNLRNIADAQSYNYLAHGDYRNAYNALREKDSLNNVFPVEGLSEAMAVQDLEQKIAIAKAEKRRADAQFRLERERKLWLLWSAIALTLLLAGITWLWLGNRRKNHVLIRQNRELTQTDMHRAKVRSDQARTADTELIAELEKWIFDKELYKQSNLTIERLAKKLNTNRTYLSEAINTHYQTGYSSWINQVRIQAARKLLASREHQHFSIEGIAQSVGYTSISSFNGSFKKITGLTPSQFRNAV